MANLPGYDMDLLLCHKGTLTWVGSATGLHTKSHTQKSAPVGVNFATNITQIIFRYKSVAKFAQLMRHYYRWILYCRPTAHSGSDPWEHTIRRQRAVLLLYITESRNRVSIEVHEPYDGIQIPYK